MGIKDLFGNEEKKLLAKQDKMLEEDRRLNAINVSTQQMQMVRAMDEDNDSTLINVTLDNTPILQQVEMSLRGIAFGIDADGNAKPIQVAPPMMNDEGVQNVMQNMVLGMNKNTVMASLTDEDIRKQAFIKHKNMVFLLAANSKRYELEPSKRTSVLWDLSITNFATMSRSAKGAEATQVYGHTKKIEHQNLESDNKKKVGIFS